MIEDICVGFSDCPCRKHRADRLAATEAHPDHAQGTSDLCGVCRTQRIHDYAASLLPMPPRLRNLIATADAGRYPADVTILETGRGWVRFPLTNRVDGDYVIAYPSRDGRSVSMGYAASQTSPVQPVSFRDGRHRVVNANR